MNPFQNPQLDQILVQDWERDLLSLPYNDLMRTLHLRLNSSFECLSHKIFSLNDFLVYFAENYDDNAYKVPRSYLSWNTTLSKRINQAKGRVKINMDSNVNLIVCEVHNIERIVQNFVKWRDSVLANRVEEFREIFKRNNKVVQPKRDIPPKSKREALLLNLGLKRPNNRLSEPQIMIDIISKNLPVHFLPQLYKSDPKILTELLNVQKYIEELDLKNQNQKNRRLMTKQRKRREQPRRNQIALHKLNLELSQDFDLLIKDFHLLFTLFQHQHCLWLPYEQISSLCNKFLHFQPEFVTRCLYREELSQIQSNSQLFMFSKKEGYEQRKNYAFIELFPFKHQFYKENPNYLYTKNEVLVPKFYPDTPRTYGVILNDLEYEKGMVDKDNKEREYQRAIEKQQTKPQYLYDLEIPQPNKKNNFCFQCEIKYEDYLDHLEGEEHRARVNSPSQRDLWKQIDDEIDLMNEQNKRAKDLELIEDSKDFSLGLPTLTQSLQHSSYVQFDRKIYRASKLKDINKTKKVVQQQEAMLQNEINNINQRPKFQVKAREGFITYKEAELDEDIVFGKRKRPAQEELEDKLEKMTLNQAKVEEYQYQQENRFNHLFTYNKQYIRCRDSDFKTMPFK